MAKHYMDLDLEIIVVDDGSPKPFLKPTLLPLDIIVLRLPFKTQPKNPCTPFNFGVSRARGKYIALSNPEMLHNEPVLEQMLESIKDDMDYVTASAWCEETKKWHAHSTVNRHDESGGILPKAQYHFMSMMTKVLWDKSGGFDEDYRNGSGYDDPDLVMRLSIAGANFIHRDDLVVEHPRKDAHAKFKREDYEINKALFYKKWS